MGRRGTMINTFVRCQYHIYWFAFKYRFVWKSSPSLLLGLLYYKYSIYLDIRCLIDDSDSKEGASNRLKI